ncbi:hypothetical protein AVEN_243583-1 [Araneus ventricosus]|uniref:Uncharacterized protein n=1 Tax=Araneus ventricosus TaxID=182803 RepID=A0A4Y2A4C6_ARAVE|nr:hypothetical protein AVEN_243583-1 [Araneus ventricosus]
MLCRPFRGGTTLQYSIKQHLCYSCPTIPSEMVLNDAKSVVHGLINVFLNAGQCTENFYVNVPFSKQHGYFGTDLAIVNCGPITRTMPEAASPLQDCAPQQREDVCPPTCDLACNRPNTRRIFSGVGFRTWNPPDPMPAPYH